VADGIRTHDHRDHNPGLYQLSYRHRGRDRIAAAERRYGIVTLTSTLPLWPAASVTVKRPKYDPAFQSPVVAFRRKAT
jgi:hypothetical protein